MSITFEIVIGEKKIQAKGKNIPRREKYESRKQKRYLGAKKKMLTIWIVSSGDILSFLIFRSVY